MSLDFYNQQKLPLTNRPYVLPLSPKIVDTSENMGDLKTWDSHRKTGSGWRYTTYENGINKELNRHR